MVAYNSLGFLYFSGSHVGLTGLQSGVSRALFLLGGLGEMCVLALPASSGHLHAWACGPLSSSPKLATLYPSDSSVITSLGKQPGKSLCLLGLPGDPGCSPHIRSIVTGSLRSLWLWKVMDHRFLPVHQGSSLASSAGIHPFTMAKPLILASILTAFASTFDSPFF